MRGLSLWDMNSSVSPTPPIVGPAVLQNTATFDQSFLDLLTKHALTVLNSWHDPTPATYHGPTGDTQIDFIATRHRTAGGRAKWSRAITGFPVGAHRLSGHYPVFAQISAVPFYLKQSRTYTSLLNKLVFAPSQAFCDSGTEWPNLPRPQPSYVSKVDCSSEPGCSH